VSKVGHCTSDDEINDFDTYHPCLLILASQTLSRHGEVSGSSGSRMSPEEAIGRICW
jgi:hypothetical protein